MQVRGDGRAIRLASKQRATPHPSPSATPSPLRGEGARHDDQVELDRMRRWPARGRAPGDDRGGVAPILSAALAGVDAASLQGVMSRRLASGLEVAKGGNGAFFPLISAPRNPLIPLGHIVVQESCRPCEKHCCICQRAARFTTDDALKLRNLYPSLSPNHATRSARRFLGKTLRLRQECPPETINTDQNEAYGKAIRALKQSGELATNVEHRQVKYINNRLEAEHGALKRVINPARGFKTPPTASATIKGLKVTRMIRKRQCLMLEPGTAGEVRFVNRLFRLAA